MTHRKSRDPFTTLSMNAHQSVHGYSSRSRSSRNSMNELAGFTMDMTRLAVSTSVGLGLIGVAGTIGRK
jgi:hypothetical protein